MVKCAVFDSCPSVPLVLEVWENHLAQGGIHPAHEGCAADSAPWRDRVEEEEEEACDGDQTGGHRPTWALWSGPSP